MKASSAYHLGSLGEFARQRMCDVLRMDFENEDPKHLKKVIVRGFKDITEHIIHIANLEGFYEPTDIRNEGETDDTSD